MKERPIHFKQPVADDQVRAILDGRMTQTRRAVKHQPKQSDILPNPCFPRSKQEAEAHYVSGLIYPNSLDEILALCPFGQPGDRLWVRETFRLFDSHAECACYDECVCSKHHGKPIYRANGDCDEAKWKPSINMPRWASRITLEITGVRVERLQDISSDDQEAEGIGACIEDPDTVAGSEFNRAEHYAIAGAGGRHSPEKMGMIAHFEAEGLRWDENPWVWVIEFKRVEQADGGE